MGWQGTFNKIAEKPPTFSQKFHTDDVSLHRSGHCFWLVETNFSLDTTNLKHYPDLGNHASSVCYFSLFLRSFPAQTSFGGETIGGAKE